MSERATPKCVLTLNPCGTDTVLVGRECSANDGICVRRLERERDEALKVLRELVRIEDSAGGLATLESYNAAIDRARAILAKVKP